MIPIPPPWVWIGGVRCEENQLEHWLGSGPVTDETVGAIQAEITEEALSSFEWSTGLSANTDLVAFAQEYWAQWVEPVARAQWSSLLQPSVQWYAGQVTCLQAWRLRHGRDEALDAALAVPFADFLEQQRGAPELRAPVEQVIDDNAATFAPRALEMLPEGATGEAWRR